MARPEGDLLEGLRGRDPAAIRDVVDQQARRIYRAARGLGFSPSDAEDLAQEVFLTFLEITSYVSDEVVAPGSLLLVQQIVQ